MSCRSVGEGHAEVDGGRGGPEDGLSVETDGLPQLVTTEHGVTRSSVLGALLVTFQSVGPGPQLLQLHLIVRRESLVSHSEPLCQARLAQEGGPHWLRRKDLEGVPEDDVGDVGGHDFSC